MFRPPLTTHISPITLISPPLSLHPKLPSNHPADILLPLLSIILLFTAPTPATISSKLPDPPSAFTAAPDSCSVTGLSSRIDRLLARQFPVCVIISTEEQDFSGDVRNIYCYGRVLKLFPTEPVTVLPLATKSDVPGVLKELKINSEIGAKAAAAIQGVGVRAESVLGVCWVAEGGGRMGEHDLLMLTDIVGSLKDLADARVMERVPEEVREFLEEEYLVG